MADLFLMSGVQQSNSGYGDWNATGGTTVGAAGADFGFGINNTTSVFPTVTLWKRFAQAPVATAGGTQTYTVADYQGTLQAYGAAGTTNMGHEQSLGRALIEWGIASTPFLQDEAVAGSSIVTHWNKTTGYGGIYANAVARAQAARAAAGIDPIACLHRQCETDTSTTSGNLAIIAGGTYYKNWYDVYFADVGVPSTTPIIAFLCNSAQTGVNQDVPANRAAMIAWKAIDSRVILIDLDHVPLHADPHYDMCGQFTSGYLIAVEIAKLKGVAIRPTPTGSTLPFYKYDEPCFSGSYNAGTSTPVPSQPRSGPVPEVGDFELLSCWSYSAVVTHVLATAAGFLPIGSQVDSAFNGTTHKAQTLYYRVLKESHFYTDASGHRRTLTPAITFGTATLCIGKITTYKNVDPDNPINAFVFGTQVTSSLSHTIPTLTATQPGCLVVLGGSDNGTSVSNSGLTNANLTSLTQRRNGRVNPGAGQVGYWIWDGVLAGTVLGTSAVTFTVASVPTSFAIALNPAPVVVANPVSPDAETDVVAIGSSSTTFSVVLRANQRYRLSGSAGFWYTQAASPTALSHTAPSVYVPPNEPVTLTAAPGSSGNKVAVIQDGSGTGWASLTRIWVGVGR